MKTTQITVFKHAAMIFFAAVLTSPCHAMVCESLFAPTSSAKDRKVISEFQMRPQPLAALLRVAANRAHGLSWDSAISSSWNFQPKFSTAPKLLASLQGPVLNYAAEAGANTAFPADFSVFPIQFFSRPLTSELGIPENAYIFNMSLPDSEIEKYFDGTLSKIKFNHLQDSFAYIRFYVHGSDLVVIEIQSEIYRAIRSQNLNPAYPQWGRQLLLAFEDYAKATFFPHHPEGRILIAGADYQQRRWRTESGPATLSPELTRMLYRDLPSKLGYKEDTIDFGFEWPGHLTDEHALAIEPIKSGYAISYRDLLSSKNQARLAMKFQSLGRGGAHRAEDALNILIQTRNLNQKESRDAKPRGSLTANRSVGPAVTVDYTPLPDSMLYADRTELQSFHHSLLAALPAWTAPFRSKTLVSLARAGKYDSVEESLRPFDRKLTYQHWPGADRHPLIFSTTDQVLSFKGGGRRTLDEKPLLKRQVFATQETDTASHQVWGGLLESHGRSEFLNHLWLLYLAKKAGFHASIGIPIDVGWMDQVPRLTANGYDLVPMATYTQKNLKRASERLVQFRSFTQSPYRVFALTQILHSDSVTEALRPVLEQLYASYGEKLEWLEPTEPWVVNSKPDHAAIYTFLNRIYLHNQAAADRILKKFSQRTLETIGFVHGLGGHLGGTGKQIFDGENDAILMTTDVLGAPSGGAPQMRNVTLAGELRDLDGGVFLPGAPLSQWQTHQEILKYNLLDFQKQDMRHWQETWYQFSSFVRGKTGVPPGTEFPQFTWGEPKHSSVIILRPYDTSPEGKARSAYLEHDFEANTVVNQHARSLQDMVLDDDLYDLYDQGLRYSRRVRHTLDDSK